MNRAKLATAVATVVSLTIGSVVWTVYTPTIEGAADVYADAGALTATHAATCAVRTAVGCREADEPAYMTVRFPVIVDQLPDGGRAVLLPPNTPLGLELGRPCLDFMEFNHCDLKTCAQDPTTCLRWLDQKPWVRRDVDARCVRLKEDAGAGTCNRLEPDGGNRYFGHLNAFPANEVGPVTSGCEPTPCVVYAGEQP